MGCEKYIWLFLTNELDVAEHVLLSNMELLFLIRREGRILIKLLCGFRAIFEFILALV